MLQINDINKVLNIKLKLNQSTKSFERKQCK